MIYCYIIPVPEELEIDGSESQNSEINSSSMKGTPPTRKAYSSPVQRTTELDQCIVTKKLQSTSERELLQAQPPHITENNSELKKDAVKSAIVVQSETNEEIAKNRVDTIKTIEKNPNGRNIVNNELLEDQNAQQKMQGGSFWKDPSHNVRDKKDNCLESVQKNSVKMKAPLQLGNSKGPTTKKKNLYSPDQCKRSESISEKERCSGDQPLEDNVFGPELNNTTLKNNAKSSDKSGSNMQGQTEKSVNLNMKDCTISNSVTKYSEQISRNDISTTQTSLTENTTADDNWISVSQNGIVENGTETKFSDVTVAQNSSSKGSFSIMDSKTEMVTKQSLHQMKQVNETTDKCINIREKSTVTATEKKSNVVQSVLTALNSLSGKGKIIYSLFTGCIHCKCTGKKLLFQFP
jgi:hypothetical protein